VTPWLRRGGRGRLADGSLLVWSVAEGARGRRWRAATTRGGILALGLLLEVGTDGRPKRLELTSPAGLLTLHPEPDLRSAHGNVVATDGVRHLALPFSPEHAFAVGDDPILTAVALHRLAEEVGVGEERDIPVVAIDPDLAVAEAVRRIVRQSASTWQVGEGRATRFLELDGRGIPTAIPSGREWPLEAD